MRTTKGPAAVTASAGTESTRRWLLLVHQLPPRPSNLRVRTWRRLQQLGAVPVAQAVYALPDSASTREDFAWLKTEIDGAGGTVTVFSAHTVEGWADDALVAEFRRGRADAYKALTQEATALLKRASRPRASAPVIKSATLKLRERFAAARHIDFFEAPGSDGVESLLTQIDARFAPAQVEPPARRDVGPYQGRVWLTRPRPGVDRMASAWLIRRFIDANPRFAFSPNPDGVANALPFDMSGVEFSHHGSHCTFETLCVVFGLSDPALIAIAHVVHDLDLKDGRFGAPEAATIGRLIEGLQMTMSDDGQLLENGMAMFEALYRSLGNGAAASRVATTRPTRRR